MNLFDYLKMLRRRLALIVAVIVVVCGGAAVLHQQLSYPVYEATSKLIVNTTNETEEQGRLDQSQLAVNMMLISTYKELMKTPPIVEKVVQLHPELGLTANELSKVMKVTSVTGSQIMTITAQDRSYARASGIANALANVFKDEMPRIMRIENVVILSEADPGRESVPQQTGLAYVLLISLIASGVLAALMVFLLETFDRSMKEAEDVERHLGIPVLASIAEINRRQLKVIKPVQNFQRAGEENHVHVPS